MKDRTTILFYLSKFFVGLRFLVPVWLIFGNRFYDLSGLGLLEAATYFLTILVDIPSGAMADLIGRKKMVVLGLLLAAISHIFIGFSEFSWHYVLWGIVGSIGASFVSGADSALIYDHLKTQGREEQYIKVQSFGAFAFRIGIIMATFAGGWLYQQAIFLPFLLLGIFEFAGALCWVFIKEPALDSVKFSIAKYLKQMLAGIKVITHNSYLRPLTVFYVLIGGITFSSFYFFNYSYALDLGFGVDGQSLLFGVTGIAKAVAVFAIGLFYKKMTRKRVFWGFAIAMLLSYLPSYFAPLWLAVVIITVVDMLGAARISLLDKFINDEIASDKRATALSTINMAINMVYLILVGLGGIFANNYGTAALYSILGVVTLVVILPLAFVLTRMQTGKS